MQSIQYFKHYIEEYLTEENSELEALYQIVNPFVLRGLLIHLMNDTLEEGEYLEELILINQLLANLLNIYKEAGVYFERYLT